MQLVILSITDSREDDKKSSEIIGTTEMADEIYLKPMVRLLKRNMQEKNN